MVGVRVLLESQKQKGCLNRAPFSVIPGDAILIIINDPAFKVVPSVDIFFHRGLVYCLIS
jgi:hypothetical protein